MGVIEAILRRVWTGTFKVKECTHLDTIQDVTPRSRVCNECVALGDRWPDLRMCLVCGYVGCCDQAKNWHAMRHFEATGHPLFRPLGRGPLYRWLWCYVDQALLPLP